MRNRLLGARSKAGEGSFLVHWLLEGSARLLLSSNSRRSTQDLGRQASTRPPLKVHHSYLPLEPGLSLERAGCTYQPGPTLLERNFDRAIRYRHFGSRRLRNTHRFWSLSLPAVSGTEVHEGILVSANPRAFV